MRPTWFQKPPTFPLPVAWRTMTEGENTTELALRAGAGDAAALAELVRATQSEVWRFTAALIDPGTADDLTQETFLRAFKALPSFEGRSSARTWLLGIARRTCADHLRAVVRRRRLGARLGARATTDPPAPGPVPPPGHRGPARPAQRGAAHRLRAHPGARPLLPRGRRRRGGAGRHHPL